MAACIHEGCNQERIADESEYCVDCLLKLLKLLPLFQGPLQQMNFKTMAEIRAYPRICKMKNCKSKTLIRGLCTKCYIAYVQAIEENAQWP